VIQPVCREYKEAEGKMEKHVKGTLFQEYVQMIRKNRTIDWSKRLKPEEMELLKQIILPNAWYPMETYQRLGAAIFEEVAKGSLDTARHWGRISMERMADLYKSTLVVEHFPLRTLEKFRVISRRFFDFDGFRVTVLGDNQATISIDRGFGELAMPAYSFQMLGSFERLIELAGGKEVKAAFTAKAWEGAPCSIIELKWEL